MSAVTSRQATLSITAWGFSPNERGAGSGGSSFNRILLAVTGSESSKRAVTFVAGLAHDHKSEVLVIHFYERVCLGRGGYWDLESSEEAAQLVSHVRTELDRRGVAAEIWSERSRVEFTASAVAFAASECAADLIVVGRPRGRSPLWATFGGSVAHALLHRTRIPVVLVP